MSWRGLQFPVVKSRKEAKTQDLAIKSLQTQANQRDEDKSRLKFWGLPSSVVDYYHSKGIERLFPWQVDCLSDSNVLQGKNLLISAPTSSGKTMIADMLLMKHSLEKRGKSIFILPFVALAREKMFALQRMLKGTSIAVGGFMGGHQPIGGFEATNIAVCTIERANNIINRLIEEEKIHMLSLVVVDEVHLLGDRHRGYLLELIIAKLRYISMSQNLKMQIVGMSATIPNVQVISDWTGAKLCSTTFRPVPLKEKIKMGAKLFDAHQIEEGEEIVDTYNISNDSDHVLFLALQTVADGYGVLIFCHQKSRCEKIASEIKQVIMKFGGDTSEHPVKERLRKALSTEKICAVLKQLSKLSIKPEKGLQQAMSFGVAYHHAGLSTEERDIVEDSFRSGTVKVVVATSTLCSGVNLPARRVIVYSPIRYGSELLDLMTYKQMVGRAGRMGIDEEGESILICRQSEEKHGEELLKTPLQPVNSCLIGNTFEEHLRNHLTRIILEAMALGLTETKDEISKFLMTTLLAKTCKQFTENIDSIVDAHLKLIQDAQFIEELSSNPPKYTVTRLAKAAIAASISPADGLLFLRELSSARSGLILNNDVHLLFHVIPSFAVNPLTVEQWAQFDSIWYSVDENVKKVASALNLNERTIQTFHLYATKLTSEEVIKYSRFYSALALNDMIQELSLSKIEEKFKISKGNVQQMQRDASTFAWMVKIFCNKLGWHNLEVLINQLQARLCFGVHVELIDLMEISLMSSGIARFLFDSGYKTIISIARSSLDALKRILLQYEPFKTNRDSKQMVWLSSKSVFMHVDDVATEMINEARKIVELQNGFVIDWQSVTSCTVEPHAPETSIANLGALDDSQLSGVQTSEILDASFYMDYGESSLCSSRDPYFEKNYDENGELADMIQTPVTNVEHSTPKPEIRRREGSYFELFDDDDDDENDSYNNDDHDVSSDSPEEKCIETATTKSKRPIEEECSPQVAPAIQKTFGELSRQIFLSELRTCSKMVIDFSLSYKSKQIRTIIGDAVDGMKEESMRTDCVYLANDRRVLTGVAVILSYTVVYWFKAEDLSDLGEMLRAPNMCLSSKIIVVSHLGTAYKIFHELFRFTHADLWTFKWMDPRLGFWLLNPDEKMRTFRQILDELTPDLEPLVCNKKLKAETAPEKLSPFCRRCLRLQRLAETIEQDLEKAHLNSVYRAVEVPSLLVLTKMEMRGIGFDKAYVTENSGNWRALRNDLEESAVELAGHWFALSSYKACRSALGAVDAENRETLSNHIHSWRKLKRLIELSQSIEDQAFADEKLQMMRVSGEVDYWTATGRVSMSSPNLLGVDRTFGVDVKGCQHTVALRRAFIPKPGSVFVSADFSQLELRVLAHFSEDPALLDALNSGRDVFSFIAASLNKKSEKDVTFAERQHAKAVCYGIIYGLSNRNLSKKLDLSEEESSTFMSNFFENFKHVQQLRKSVVENSKETGGVKTLYGRIRKLPNLSSPNAHARAKGERQAINTLIQGSAADIVKMVQIEIDRRLTESKLPASLVLQVHDELFFEVQAQHAAELCCTLDAATKHVSSDLLVNLPLKCKTGANWADLSDFDSF